MTIYALFRKGKATKQELMARYNISERRFYQILGWAEKHIYPLDIV